MAEETLPLKRGLDVKQKKQHCNKKTQGSLVPVPYLPKDCIFDTIIRLPLESLKSSRFVCKTWYGIVNSPAFIHTHLHRSEMGIIVLTQVRNGLPSNKTIFSVESNVSKLLSLPIQHYWPLIDPPPLYYMNFIEIKDGKGTVKEYNTSCMGNIRATCNGLIILENRTKIGGLILMNTVTREMKPMPLGTKIPFRQESYGLAFCNDSGVYKLVHLFQDELRYVGCEIMEIGKGSWRWRAVDGPVFGLFGWFGYQPVFAMGALHWIPNVDRNEYMVSMPLVDEKFVKTRLPTIVESQDQVIEITGESDDRLIEIGGFLGFVSRKDFSSIVVWVLRSLGDEVWEQLYTIGVDFGLNVVPLYCKGIYDEIIFRGRDYELYAFDYKLQVMKKIELDKEGVRLGRCFFPHVNSLISWQGLGGIMGNGNAQY